MKNLSVKRKLALFAIVPFALVVIILLELNYINNIIEERDKENKWLAEVSYLTNQLYSVGYDVLFYVDEDRPRLQWEMIFKRMSEHLDKQSYSRENKDVLIERLKLRQKRLSELYDRMKHKYGSEKNTDERKNQLIRQMLFQTQAIKQDLSLASKKSRNYYNDIRHTMVVTIAVVALSLTLIVSVFIYYLYMSICAPIDILKMWSEDFVSGHLDKKIELDDNNEFKKLANNFSELGDQVKQYHLDLEAERDLRREAEIKNNLLVNDLNTTKGVTAEGSLYWNIRAGEVYLTPAAARVLAIQQKNEMLKFDDFIKLIDPDDQKTLLFTLEQCRTTGKSFDIICRLMTGMSSKKIVLMGRLYAVSDYRYISINIKNI